MTAVLGRWLQGKKGITVLRIDPNVNSAGAFYEGLKYAFQKGFDAYMFFDDDAEPDKDCIKNLMLHFSEEIGFLAPLAYNRIKGEYQFFQNKIISEGLLLDVPAMSAAENPRSGTIKLDANATTGIVVNHKAVQRVGNFNRHLKTYGEDVDFTFRVSRHFPCCLVPEARLIHKVQPSDAGTQPLKSYYWIRNRFYLIRTQSQKKYAARYALYILGRGIKDTARFRSLKTTLYRFAAVGKGLFGEIPAESLQGGLYARTPDVTARVVHEEKNN